MEKLSYHLIYPLIILLIVKSLLIEWGDADMFFFFLPAKVFDLALGEIEKKSPSGNEEKGGCVIM